MKHLQLFEEFNLNEDETERLHKEVKKAEKEFKANKKKLNDKLKKNTEDIFKILDKPVFKALAADPISKVKAEYDMDSIVKSIETGQKPVDPNYKDLFLFALSKLNAKAKKGIKQVQNGTYKMKPDKI